VFAPFGATGWAGSRSLPCVLRALALSAAAAAALGGVFAFVITAGVIAWVVPTGARLLRR